MKLKISLILLALIIAAAAASAISYKIGYARSEDQTRQLVSGILPTRENNFNYKFIFPLLGYSFGNARYLLEDHSLENQINNYIQNQYPENKTDSISVYYRNFLTNQWSGVNADVQYHPGSIMKVLIMVGYYRQSHLDPTVLQKTLLYNKEVSQQTNGVNFSLPSNLIVGKSYTVEQLIEAMIENSDNGAETLLLNNIDHKILNDVYNDLNIKNPDEVSDFTISPTQYAAFLRILYNATYLSDVESEKALSIMSQSTFHDGIATGVPAGIATAQKYGERVDSDTSGNVQAIEFHNCGIIYAPSNPYELCIMTKAAYDGKGQADAQRLAGVIKDISRIVYSYVVASK